MAEIYLDDLLDVFDEFGSDCSVQQLSEVSYSDIVTQCFFGDIDSDVLVFDETLGLGVFVSDFSLLGLSDEFIVDVIGVYLDVFGADESIFSDLVVEAEELFDFFDLGVRCYPFDVLDIPLFSFPVFRVSVGGVIDDIVLFDISQEILQIRKIVYGVIADFPVFSYDLNVVVKYSGNVLSNFLIDDIVEGFGRYLISVRDFVFYRLDRSDVVAGVISITDFFRYVEILKVVFGVQFSFRLRYLDLLFPSLEVYLEEIGLKFQDVFLFVFLQKLIDILRFDVVVDTTRFIVEGVESDLVFEDFADFIKEVLSYALYLYFNFYMPERFSIVEVPVQNRSDTIFCLGDGLYELDYSEVVSDTVVALNLAQLSSSRVKRLDKIYYDTQPKQVRVYVDGERYNFDGEENYVTLPKGLRGKDWKVVLDGMKNVEYIDLGVFFESRGKK